MRLRSLVVAAALFSAVFALATPAHARPAPAAPAKIQSAAGSTPVGSFEYSHAGVTIKVPIGCFLTHVIRGDDRRVSDENAGIDCAGAGTWGGGFCNWRIAFLYYDTNNRLYYTWPGKTFTNCDFAPWYMRPGYTAGHYGRACAVFYVNGIEKARQCHSITS
jgi:hypothetical protein